MKMVDIDEVPVGTFVYSAPGVCLGRVEFHLEMNGDRPAVKLRCLNNGMRNDRFKYRKLALYREAKMRGGVFIKGAKESAG